MENDLLKKFHEELRRWIIAKLNMDQLMHYIINIQLKINQTYGYRRIQLELLKTHGLIINHKTVLRIMQKYNLLSDIRRKYKYKGSQIYNKYENLFARDFNSGGINQKWCTDISYILTSIGRLYLSVIKDCLDSSIVAYNYSTSMSMNLVTSTIKQAVKKKKVTDRTQLHSDQGFQYTSTDIFETIFNYIITEAITSKFIESTSIRLRYALSVD